MELWKKRKVNEETYDQTWMLSKKPRELKLWRDYINHKIDVAKELDADFNFRKIHLMSHWVELIRWHRALQQNSSDRHEQAHETNLKDGWNASNHNLNYLPQVVTCQHRILCFKVWEHNLQAVTQRWENRAAPCNVLPSGVDLPAPLSPQSYPKPRFIWPHICCDGQHPDAMAKDLRE